MALTLDALFALYREDDYYPKDAPLTVHSRSEFGSLPLHFAARLGAVEQIALLLKHGADVNAVGEDGATPLHDAAGNGMTEAAQALLEAGADPAAKDEDGATPAELAEEMGEEDTAALIRGFKGA